jgi:uncharacterized damage-inducible protein DinB
MSIAAIRTLYERHWWANRLLAETAEALGESVVAREIGRQFSAPSLKGLLYHIYEVDRLWLSRWNGISPTSVPAETDEAPTLAALRDRWVTLEKEQASFLNGLRENDLTRVVEYRLISGKDYRVALELLLYHVVDHGTHHRSEVATMLTMVSGSPPGTGLALFCTTSSSEGTAA